MKERISLAAAIIALTTAIISLITSFHNAEKIESIEECHVEITINEPQNGDHVPAEFDVSGTSTIHDKCRYVFIIIRGVSPPVQYWKVTDIVQVDKRGQWSGRAVLKDVPIGMEPKIHARVSNKPSAYRINQILPSPPVEGVLSNVVKVRRIR